MSKPKQRILPSARLRLTKILEGEGVLGSAHEPLKVQDEPSRGVRVPVQR